MIRSSIPRPNHGHLLSSGPSSLSFLFLYFGPEAQIGIKNFIPTNFRALSAAKNPSGFALS
jgi:hypothetical protein